MDTFNSFSEVIKRFSQLNTNSLEIFEGINRAVSSEEDSVKIKIDLFGKDTPEGEETIQTYEIPSFSYLDREIKRLNDNLKALTGLGSSDVSVRMADGSYKKIIAKKFKSAGANIESLSIPTFFESKHNDFFEDYLNPLLSVNFDVGSQIPLDTERVLVKRILFPSSDAFAKTYFEDNYVNSSELDHQTVINSIIADGVNVTFDEQVRDLPYRSVQYYGKFDITGVENAKKEVVIDGNTTTRTVKLFTVNKLTYSDSNKDLKETEYLSIGDKLLVNNGNNSTLYEIANIYNGTLQLELKLLEGFDSIKIGAEQLCIYKSLEDSVKLNINVGFDERQVIFFKPIDPDSKILAEDWSPGVGFYSNDLTIKKDDGLEESLSAFYRNSVADFGQFIKSLKEDFIPPATVGIEPDPVKLDVDNFKVIQINTHLTENDAFDNIKKLSNDKITVAENIKKLDGTIVSKRSEIATKTYKSDIEKNKDKNALNTLVEKRSSEAKLYSSIVNQIQSINKDQNITELKPKFRVRGFWNIPEAKTNEDTLPQEIVKFKIQYRYVSSSGKASNVDQIPFKQTIGGKTKTTTASFSNWIAYETPTRERKRDAITGKYYWSTTNVEDGQEVNFNQLDLPINLGENVEIRIKAISEAGYPANPTESDWSEIIKIDFPEGLLDTSAVVNLIDENSKETTYVQLVEELDSKGLYTHISDSFTANEKYYTHGATNIASGFLSDEQAPISLFDKLIDLQNEINSLREQLENAVGELSVSIVDDEGVVTVIEANTTTRIFAGYYTDEVADLNIRKGHIVNKTYKLLLENSKATDLELIARIIGDRDDPVFQSSVAQNIIDSQMGTNDYSITPSPVVNPRVVNDTYYTVEGRYDMVPVQYQNITTNQYQNNIHYSQNPYQSAQHKGQWLYSRFMNVSGEKALYSEGNFDYSMETSATTTNTPADFEIYGVNGDALPGATNSGNLATDFIWRGTFDGGAATGNTPDAVNVGFLDETTYDYDNNIFVHVDHPYLRGTTPSWFGAGSTVHSRWAKLMSNEPFSYMQCGYKHQSWGRGTKMGFEENDQFLLGGASCGSYLFISPTNTSSLRVNADNKFGKKTIGSISSKEIASVRGKSAKLSIDVVFQYRMTDYFGVTEGDGSSPVFVDNNNGLIAGRKNIPVGNLTYSKTIGIDIFDSNENQFSFDLQVFAKYKPKGLNLKNVRSVRLINNPVS